jgi:hypothetical protein
VGVADDFDSTANDNGADNQSKDQNVERGDPLAPDPSTHGGGRTTCLAITAGVTIKPPVPKPFAGLLIRPEVRCDRALTDKTLPFDQLTDRDQWTFGIDAILEF